MSSDSQVDEHDPQHLRKVIGQNIRRRRMALNLRQEDIGDAVGYARRWVAKLEQGRASCRIEYLPKLLKALKLPDFDALLKLPD